MTPRSPETDRRRPRGSAVLITGNPGSGKSTVAAELARRGRAVVDGDDLAHYETAAGGPVEQPLPTPDDWSLRHRWVWSRRRIEGAIREYGRGLFVCGIAMNQRELLDLFDPVFLLRLDHETQIERLNTPSNAHRTAAARAQILDGRPVFEAEMLAVGAIALDARLAPPILADRILSYVTPR